MSLLSLRFVLPVSAGLLLLVAASLLGSGSSRSASSRPAELRPLAEGADPQDARPTPAKVVEIVAWNRVKLEDGRVITLQGIGLPDPAVRPPAFELEVRDALRKRALWGWFHVTTEKDPGPEAAGGATIGTLMGTDQANLNGGSLTLNEWLLADGLVLLSCRTRTVERFEHLLAAANRAREQRRGWFARTPVAVAHLPVPPQRGAVLGLYYREEQFAYHQHLDEMADLKPPWVSLLLTCFVPKVDSNEIVLDNARTVTDARLIETIRYARGKGFRLMVLPIVLIIDAAIEDWRGTLRPSDREAFWRSYDRFICHYADICQAEGVEILAVGSEYCTLEKPEHTPSWRRVIQNVRGRFNGWITYSANWDHAHVPQFWDLVDFAGMTAYFKITEKKDPTLDELVAGWAKVKDELRQLKTRIGKPILLTEIGYPAIDGGNVDPWDYVSNKSKLDLEEQRLATQAFVKVWKDDPLLLGAYLFDFFENGGPGDSSYSPRGKPVLETWKEWVRSK